MSHLEAIGLACFGAVIGWYVYYINRYRKGDVQLSDITTLVAAIGGGAAAVLLPSTGDDALRVELFAAYGIGLFIGFFGYFVSLIVLVRRSPNFDADWFLDGRRKAPEPPFMIPDYVDQTIRPAALQPELPPALHPVVQVSGGSQVHVYTGAAPPPEPHPE